MLERIKGRFNRDFAPFLVNRDFITLDQRGAGLSEPELDCPEYLEMVYDTREQDLSAREEVALKIEAISACHDRLASKGINLTAYTSAENAADLNDLRIALGYDKWNLYGISYGTRLALTAMRDFPEGIRSVILDSSVPLQAQIAISAPALADRAFNVLFEGCKADPDCNSAYPELESVLYELTDQLNDTPATIPIALQHRGVIEESLDGDRLMGFLVQSLHRTGIISQLPKIIFDARDGEFRRLARLEGGFLASLKFRSLGMMVSAICNEEVPFIAKEEAAAVAEGYPRLQFVMHGHVFASETIFTICAAWSAREVDPIENLPVVSDIPTLVLAGEYDPSTPPAWGRLVAKNLSNSFYFEVPGVGHGVTNISTPCPRDIALAFLDQPATAPDAFCVATMSGPKFIGR